ncbi:putative carbonic anhydrase [Helianthus annuus]|nr:putative carbonic anhydrase [Helianthus annuus]KAJ0923403.1 putative carbonic anhydrase [Helianthus annuus]
MAREQLQSETVNVALSRTSFIKNWVKVRKATKSITKATTSNLSFDQQCKHCEKETLEIKYIYEIQAHNVEPLEIRVTRK